MSKFALVIFGVLMATAGYTQQDYFVLIQSDNSQPFYLRMAGKTLSSSAEGHLILSGLKDSTWMITIGFPRKLYPEEDFSISVNKKDLGFQLKDLDVKGWALFNSQTLELVMPNKKDSGEAKTPTGGVKKDDAFSRLMAAVVGDTAVMYSTDAMDAYLKDSARSIVDALQRPAPAAFVSPPVNPSANLPANPPVNPPADNKPTGIPDSSALPVVNLPAASDTNLASRRTDSPALAPAKGRPVGKTGFIEKLGEKRTETAIQLSFADHRKGHKIDTVKLSIAFDSLTQISQNQIDTVNNKGGPLTIRESGAAGTAPKAGADSGIKKLRIKPVVVNSDCRNFATDMDTEKLRLRLLGIAKDDDKILDAKKTFRMKCFSSRQVRTLSGAFATDGGKYRFLEAAYPFVSDDAFRELSDLMTDPVYIGKFKTMTGQ
jgi:hypothetical protein